jgi:hypothetical protein
MESLERRRLLSLSLLGGDRTLPFPGEVTGIDVSTAADGRSIIAARTVDGQTTTVSIIRYAANGQQIGGPLVVDSFHSSTPDTPTGGDATVSVSINDSGEAMVAWQIPDFLDEDPGIYVAHVSPAGLVSAPILARPDTPDSAALNIFNPAVAIDEAGGYFVGWNEDHYILGPPTEAVDVFYAFAQAFGANDQPKHEAFILGIESDDRGYPEQLEIAALPDGSGAVFAMTMYRNYLYQTDRLEYGRTTTSEALANPSGEKWLTAWRDDLDGYTTDDDADQPSIDIHPDGSFIIAYRRYNTTQTAGDITAQAAYAQRFNPAGESSGDPIELAASLPGEGIRTATHSPAVAFMADGGFVAAFFQTIGDTDTLYARRYDAASAPDPAGPIALATRPSVPLEEYDSTHPTPVPMIAADGLGHASLAYRDANVAHLRILSTDRDLVLENGSLTILGTASDDTIAVRAQSGNIIAQRNAVTESFPAADVQFISINGLDGNDEITNNTALPSTLSGGEGDDTVYGGDADDKIRGEGGRDSLWGREGNDTLFGDDGVDSLYGNGGRDRIDGGANSDHMRGNAGRDKLFGGHGNDRMYGSESADWLYGGIGDDHLYGEGSNDILDGESGIDTLEGLAGDDVLVSSGDSVIDSLIGGRGRDTAIADQDDLLEGIETLA